MTGNKERIKTYLKLSLKEMELIEQMSKPIKVANDFGTDLDGMTIFRACSMSLQYITENFVKIRNKMTASFFASYKEVPWGLVFGMRNTLAHEYVDVDDEAVFNTIREDLPILKATTLQIIKDIDDGKLDKFFPDEE